MLTPSTLAASRARALGQLHTAAVLFGLTGVFGHLIAASADVITLGRALFAVLTLLVYARVRGQPALGALTPSQLFMLALSGVLISVHWVTFFISVKTGGIAIATLGFASFPAFITLFEGLLFNERVRAAEWLALALVTLGLLLVTPSFDLADQGTAGLAWGLLSGLTFALMALNNRRATGPRASLSPIQVACWQNLMVALFLLPFSVADLPGVSAPDWLWLVLLGIFCTGLSHLLFVSALVRVNARSAGLVIALEPVYAIAFAWLLFAQQPTLRMLAGAALIMAAIVWSGMRKPDTSSAPHMHDKNKTHRQKVT
jgi:drug/metabolite transporter (DMT)-like permease